MGWTGGNQIADRTLRALEQNGEEYRAVVKVTQALVESLLDEDWDTWDEVLAEWRHDPAVVEGFRLAGCELTTCAFCDDPSGCEECPT